MKSFTIAVLMGLASAQFGRRFQTNPQHSHPDLSGRITTVETDISALETSLTAVETKCDAQGTDIGTLTGQVTQLGTWVNPLYTDTQTYSGQIAGINALLPSLTSRVGTLETDLMAEKVKVAVLETQIGTVTSLETRIAALESTVSTDLSDLTTRVITIEGNLPDIETDITDNGTSISALATRISNLETQAASLQTSVDTFEGQKITSDYFSVNAAILPLGTLASADVSGIDVTEDLLDFCAGSEEFVEVFLTASVGTISAATYLKEIYLELDGMIVASDAKSAVPAGAGEDRSFTLFYKAKLSSGDVGNFKIVAVTDNASGEEVEAPAGSIAFGYRTYASSFPVASSAATCS